MSGTRALAANPAFTLTAMAVLAIGIGANSAMFSVVKTVLLRPVPWEDPDRLVRGAGSAAGVRRRHQCFHGQLCRLARAEPCLRAHGSHAICVSQSVGQPCRAGTSAGAACDGGLFPVDRREAGAGPALPAGGGASGRRSRGVAGQRILAAALRRRTLRSWAERSPSRERRASWWACFRSFRCSACSIARWTSMLR